MSERTGLPVEIETPDGTGTQTIRDGEKIPSQEEALASYLDARRQENPEWFDESIEAAATETETEATTDANQPSEEQASTEAVAEEKEAATDSNKAGSETAAVEKSETDGQALRKILAREKKLRDEKSQFEADQKENREKMAQYEQAKRLASVDPLSFLKSLGVEGDQLVDVAKSIYYEILGEDAPEEDKGERAALQARREVAALRAELEQERQQREKAQAQQSNTAELEAYQAQMVESVKTFDTDKFPTMARVVEAYGEQAVANDLMQAAVQVAQAQNSVITAEQGLQLLEDHYGRLLGPLTGSDTPQEEAETEQKKAPTKTLRNSMTKTQPPSKEPQTLDEIKADARAKFNAALKNMYEGG